MAKDTVAADKSYKDEEEKWKAEADMRTLIEYHEIMADNSRYKAAMACAKDKASAMEKVMKGHSK